MLPHEHHRSEDADDLVYIDEKFCDLRHKEMDRRIDMLETSNKDLVEQTNKANVKLAVILGVIVFVSGAAGLLMQYIAILPMIRGVHP
jgi:hypothetical protein